MHNNNAKDKRRGSLIALVVYNFGHARPKLRAEPISCPRRKIGPRNMVFSMFAEKQMQNKAAIFAVGLFVVGYGLSFAQSSASASKIARGKYLVQNVAQCGDCHSPHDEKGEAIRGKELRGGMLEFKPTAPVPNWADKSPNIAGLRGWEDADAVKFLMTGLAYNDLPARPPMPQYKMNKEDAEAVVEYLKSLSPVAK